MGFSRISWEYKSLSQIGASHPSQLISSGGFLLLLVHFDAGVLYGVVVWHLPHEVLNTFPNHFHFPQPFVQKRSDHILQTLEIELLLTRFPVQIIRPLMKSVHGDVDGSLLRAREEFEMNVVNLT